MLPELGQTAENAFV